MTITKSELRALIKETLKEELRLRESKSEQVTFIYLTQDQYSAVGAALQKKVAEQEGLEPINVKVITNAAAFTTIAQSVANKEFDYKLYSNKASLEEFAQNFKNVPPSNRHMVAAISNAITVIEA